MDRHQAMTTFVTVVETAGFASAARKLKVSPSVISRVMAELEAHLGVRLLTRTTRVVKVTDAGAAYFEDCRRILGEIDAAELAVGGANATPRGQLTVTAPALFGRLHVMPVVQDYLARYPSVNVNCWFLDRIVNLVDEGADVAIRIGELPDSTLQAVPVGKVRRLLCASPAYLKKHGTPREPAELAAHTTIQMTSHSGAPEWRFLSAGKTYPVAIQPRLVTTTNDSAIVAALAGVGIARVLSYQVTDELAAGALRIVLAEHELTPLPVQVVHREGKHPNQKVRAFLDLAIDQLRARAPIWQR
ncbi:MAG: LysR substrate-binding domain-containing protein [Bordetella sp.]|nr:LysR substrate-binding domain-containing protein [Bordetella sp.]